MTKEQEILNSMKLLGISKEEAEQLYEDDHSDVILPEVEEMERNAKKFKRYEKSDAPRKKTEKVRKVDEEKGFLLNLLYNGVLDEVVNLGEKKNESEFSFTYNGNSYTVKLIKHRPPKA